MTIILVPHAHIMMCTKIQKCLTCTNYAVLTYAMVQVIHNTQGWALDSSV